MKRSFLTHFLHKEICRSVLSMFSMWKLWKKHGHYFDFLVGFLTACNLWLIAIPVKIYWHFWLFPRFSKFEVLAKKSILGYLLNVIGYFNLRGVYRLPCWNIIDLLDPEILRS